MVCYTKLLTRKAVAIIMQNSQKDLLEWLGLLKDEVITEIKKIAKICPIVGEVIVMGDEDD